MSDSAFQKRSDISIDAIREDLVAYLDGELSSEEAARIERLVEQDTRIRSELQRLAETWDWLDVLDRPTVDEDFTRTTIEMVAQSAASEVVAQTQTKWKRRAIVLGVAVLGTLLAVWGGWQLASFLWENPNKWLIEHYAVIQNQDYYRHIENVAFLRMLRDSGLYTDEEEYLNPDDAQEVDEWRMFRPPGPPGPGQGQRGPAGAGEIPGEGGPTSNLRPEPRDNRPSQVPRQPLSESSGEKLPSGSTAVVTSKPVSYPASSSVITLSDPAEIRKHIAGLTDAEKVELRRKIERFQQLSPSEQARMKAIHEELMQAPDRDELIAVMQRYYEWFKLLTPSQRGELETLEPAQRISWIQKTRNEMLTAAFSRALFSFPPERLRTLLQDSMRVPPEERLPPGDVAVLVRFVESLAAERGEELLAHLNSGEKQDLLRRLSRVTDPQQRRDFLAITWFQWQLDHPEQASALTPQELEELRKQFSPGTRARLESLSTEEQLKRVAQWIRSYVFFKYVMPRVWADMRRAVSEQELGRFVEENLTREEREKLLALPPDEMQRELTRRYLRWRYPGFDTLGPWRGHGGERRGPRPGPGEREPPPGPGGSSDRDRGDGPPPQGPGANDVSTREPLRPMPLLPPPGEVP